MPSARDSYALTTIGYMGNNVLPARAGELLRVCLLARAPDAGKRDVLATIVAERLLDASRSASSSWCSPRHPARRCRPGAGRSLILGSRRGRWSRSACVALRVAPPRAAAGAACASSAPARRPPRALLSARRRRAAGLSFVIWALEAGVYLAVAHAVDLGIGAVGALYVVALTNLFALLPAAPGYVGTFDAAVVFGVKALGGTGSAALPYLLLLRFVLFVPITLVGLVVLVVRYGGWSARRAARLETACA